MELLERSTYLDTLAGYADEAGNGNGRMVLISGESGIGKTAVVEAFQAQLLGARWLLGACDGLLTPRPLGPLFDIAAQAGGRLLELCREGATRDQLFEAFLAELDSPAALTVAVIEDVHWADESTIDLLRFVGRRLSRMKALVLVTYRDDEFGDDALLMLLGDLATQRATRRIGLPPLSDEAVRALAGQRDVDAAELCRVTGGNPFLVCEAIEGRLARDPADGARRGRRPPGPFECPGRARQYRQPHVIGTILTGSLLASVLDGSAALLDDCLRTGLLTADASARCGSGMTWSGWRRRKRSRRIARANCTHGCWRCLRTMAMPTPPCWPTTLKALATLLPSGCTRWPRRAGRQNWAPTARPPHSTSGLCATPTPLTGRRWPNCTKELAAEYLTARPAG